MSQPRTAGSSPLVGAPLLPTLTRLAIPGVLGALIQSLLPALEAWYLSRTGTGALAAVALVFPLIMLANMLAAGAIGGATSGAVARAIGAGDAARASAVYRSAVLIAITGGALMGVVLLTFASFFFKLIGAQGNVLTAALAYGQIAFAGLPLIWLFNMLSAVMRGTGDMTRPAIGMVVIAASYALLGGWLIPTSGSDLSAVMQFAAIALLGAYACGSVVLIYFLNHPGQPVRFQRQWPDRRVTFDILKPGLLAGMQSVMTIIYALVATALLGRLGIDWLAGYGLAVRLELLMIPAIFGIGASLIAIVGAHVGAGQTRRAISIAWRGTAANVAVVGIIGIGFALAPQFWCDQVASNESVSGNCQQTLQILGPFYGFFALGLGLYFASQGLNTLIYPVSGALVRLLLVATGLLWVGTDTDPAIVLWTIAGAMIAYGIFVATCLWRIAWRIS